MIKDLTEEAEAKLAVEVLAAQTLRQEKHTLVKEASEVGCAGTVPTQPASKLLWKAVTNQSTLQVCRRCLVYSISACARVHCIPQSG